MNWQYTCYGPGCRDPAHNSERIAVQPVLSAGAPDLSQIHTLTLAGRDHVPKYSGSTVTLSMQHDMRSYSKSLLGVTEKHTSRAVLSQHMRPR